MLSMPLLTSLILMAALVDSRATKRQDTTSGDSASSDLATCMNPQNTAQGMLVDSCKPKNVMDASGNCGPLTAGNNCVAYCQVSVSWKYGTEVPFPNTECSKSDDSCSITNTNTTSVSNEFSFNVGGTLGNKKRDGEGPGLDAIKAGFNAGATWSYTQTKSTATATQNTKPKNADGQCGYWTFVPYYVTSCGSISTGVLNAGDTSYDPNEGEICGTPKTTGNFCQTTPYLNSDGSAAGETVFVAVDCTDHWPEAFCFQQAPYLEEGVAQNASVYNDQVKAHVDFDVTKPFESTPSVWCEQGKWPLQPDS